MTGPANDIHDEWGDEMPSGADSGVPPRVWLEINLTTLRGNFREIARMVSPCAVMAVLKANAYGLGVERMARCLRDAGAACFGVAEVREALALKPLGRPVHVLGGVLPEEAPAAIDGDIVLPVTDLEIARVISRLACQRHRRARGHILVDTGMGRLGVPVAEAMALIREAARLPGLVCEGIYTHLPLAYRRGADYTNRQIADFQALLRAAAAEGIEFEQRHLANSDAINNFPETYRAPFNLVRTGINLHGAFNMEGRRALSLDSVLCLKTRLAAVRRLPAGMSTGYGCTYTLPRDTLVGTISAGYADGLPLALSNRGYVLIRGRPCHVLGRVSMDYVTVSLDQAPDAKRGDEVVCLGGEGPHAISVDDWAQLKGTHPYDIICSLGGRVARRYRDGAG